MYLGLVTPQFLLPEFMTAVKNMTDVELVPLIYSSIAEAALLVEKNQEKVDAVFFAGPSPYFLSTVSVERVVPWFHLGLPTEGIPAALLQARQYLNGPIRFSLDSIGEPDIRQVLHESGLNVDRITTCPYSPSPGFEEELVAFHSRCFWEKKARFCLTCHHLTKTRLTEEGIPAFYIAPTVHSMRDAIELSLLFLRKQSADYLRTVVGFYAIESVDPSGGGNMEEAREFIWDFARRRHILMIRKEENLFQGLFSYGQFLIISEQFSRSLLMEEFESNFPGIRLRMGYGLSSITRTAEDRAQRALEMSRREAGNSIYLFDGTTWRRMGDPQAYVITPQERRLAQKMQVTEGTLLRYMRTFRAMEGTFSAREFANAAGIHPKSSRKILNRFLEEGLLEVEGKRSAVARGRPEILYRVPSLHAAASEE